MDKGLNIPYYTIRYNDLIELKNNASDYAIILCGANKYKIGSNYNLINYLKEMHDVYLIEDIILLDNKCCIVPNIKICTNLTDSLIIYKNNIINFTFYECDSNIILLKKSDVIKSIIRANKRYIKVMTKASIDTMSKLYALRNKILDNYGNKN